MLERELQELSILKAELDTYRPLPRAVVQELRFLYLIRFTYNSNAIEGNTLTQSETEIVLERGITIGGKTLKEHLEVIGHRDAFDYIQALSDRTQAEKITQWEIRQIHNLILRAIAPDEAGTYRTLNVRSAGTEFAYPEHYLIPQLMTDCVDWLQQAEADSAMHPVVLATEAHLRFVSIHPFRDGNGRTGRLLMNLLLLRGGYPIAVIQNAQRAQYIDALVAAQQQAAGLEPLLKLVCEVEQQSLEDVLALVRS